MADEIEKYDPYADDYNMTVMPNFQLQTQVNIPETGSETEFLPEPKYLPIQPNTKPIQLVDLDKKQLDKPGFFHNLAHAFATENTFVSGLGAGFNRIGMELQLTDDADPNFNPYQEKYLAGYPQKWWSYLANSINEQELMLKQQYVIQQIANEEYYNNGSFMSAFIGGGLGFATSPESLLIPIASSIKYARVSETFLKNTMAAMPGITTQVAAHEMLQQQIKAQDEMSDMAFNIFRDSLFAIGMHGGIQMFSGGVTSAKIYNTRKASSYLHKGVDNDVQVDINGGNPRIIAKPTTAESAKYVDDAQRFYDSEMARTGLYGLPYIGRLAEKSSQFTSPTVWGLSSRFKTTNALTSLFADTTIKIRGEETGIDKKELSRLQEGLKPGSTKEDLLELLGLEDTGVTKEQLQEQLSEKIRGLNRGKAKEDSAEFLRDFYTAETQNKTHQIMGMYYEANGMTADGASSRNALKSMAQHFAGKEKLNYYDYGRDILTVVNTGTLSENKTVNAAAELYAGELNKIWHHLAEIEGFDPTQHTVSNAQSYAMTIVKHDKLLADQQGYIDDFVADVSEQRTHVEQLKTPLDQINAQIAEQEKIIGDTPEEIAENAKVLKGLKRKRKQIQDNITQTLMKPENFYMRENQNFISPEQAKEVEEFLKPLEEAKQFHKEKKESYELNKKQVQALESELKSIRAKIRKSAKSFEKAKTEKTKEKHQNIIDEQKKLLEQTESNLAERKANLEESEQLMINAEEEINKVDAELKSRAEEGELDRNLYYADTNGNVLKFKTRDDLPKLKTFPEDLEKAAIQDWEKRVQYTPEQIIQSVMGSEFPHMYENPLKSRTTLRRYDKMLQSGWLDTDAPKLLMNYSRTMHNVIALKEKWGDLNLANGPEDFVKTLKREYDTTRQDIEKEYKDKPKDKTYTKQIKKLNDDFEKNKNFIRRLYRAYFRQYNYSPTVRKVVRALRNVAAMTRLGNVPLTQIADIGTMIMKTGFWPLIKNNAEILLRQMNGTLRDDREKVMRSARNNLMGLNHALDINQDLFHNSQYMSDLRGGDRITTVLDTMGNLSGNLSLMNHIDNWQQSFVTTTHGANIMDALHDYKAGTIKNRDLEMLLKYGIDPKVWADRMINQFEEFGFTGDFGGRHARHYDWNDFEAQQRFSKSVMRATRDTVLRKGIFDGPFMSNDPVFGMLLLFKGYAFSAFNRITVPLMQSPDLQKIVGAFSMLALGSMIEPLRKLAKGEEVSFEDEAWFTNAMTDGNVLGVFMDGFQDVNNIMHGQLLRGIHNDRWRNRTIMGVLGGPIPGLMQDAVDVLTQYWTGQINERDTKKALRMIPFSQMWYFRGISNKFLESLNLPKSADSAEPYYWRDTQ